METIRACAKDVTIGVSLVLLTFFLPLFRVSDLGTLVTATSSVFAIVVGFFIADAMSNYLRLQTLIAEEDAALISLADNAKKIDPVRYVQLHQAIDDYMITVLNLKSLNYSIQTERQIEKIEVAIDALQIGPNGKELYDHLLSMKEKILACRQEVSLAAKKTMTIGHWLVLITLAGLVVTTVLGLRDGRLLMDMIACFMILGTQAILILLREMDSNYFLEKKLAYEGLHDVFRAVGQPPYFPHFSPVRSRSPNEAGLYRLGTAAGDASYEVIAVPKA